MSIEKLLTELIDSIQKNTAVTEQLISLRADAIETVKSAAAPAAKATKAAAAPKAAETPKAPETDPYDGIKDLIASYLGGSDRTEEREARSAKIKALLNHEKIKKEGVADAKATTDIREDAVELFKSQVNLLIEKGDLTEAKAEGESLV